MQNPSKEELSKKLMLHWSKVWPMASSRHWQGSFYQSSRTGMRFVRFLTMPIFQFLAQHPPVNLLTKRLAQNQQPSCLWKLIGLRLPFYLKTLAQGQQEAWQILLVKLV